jgi:hypothetical protein
VAPPDAGVGRPLHVLDVELEPPAGQERLFAVWSQEPLAMAAGQLQSLVEEGRGSTPCRASRDMKRVEEAVRRLGKRECHVVVLDLEHTNGQ